MATWVDRIRRQPFQAEPYSEADATGRINQVAVVGDLLSHYWSDHTEQTVRLVRIEPVD